jgi:hypothetical protein
VSLEEGNKTRRFCARSLIGREPLVSFSYFAFQLLEWSIPLSALQNKTPFRWGRKEKSAKEKEER